MMRSTILALAFCLCSCGAHPHTQPTMSLPPPPTLADLQREVHLLEADATRACEQMCVSQVVGQCVLLAVEPYEFVSDECVGDKARACLLNCAP